MFKEDIYSKSLHETGKPVMLSDMKESVDIRGLLKYAEEKGVSASELTPTEKQMFVSPVNHSQS